VLQIALVAAAATGVVTVAVATRRFPRPVHDPVDLTGLGLPPGIVIFTSTECANCKDAIAVVRRSGVAVREVTWELEGRLLERAGVTAVPLTVVLDGAGRVVDQMAGVPRRRRLQRALAAKSLAAPTAPPTLHP